MLNKSNDRHLAFCPILGGSSWSFTVTYDGSPRLLKALFVVVCFLSQELLISIRWLFHISWDIYVASPLYSVRWTNVILRGLYFSLRLYFFSFLEPFKIYSNTEGKVQRFPAYPCLPHAVSAIISTFPLTPEWYIIIDELTLTYRHPKSMVYFSVLYILWIWTNVWTCIHHFGTVEYFHCFENIFAVLVCSPTSQFLAKKSLIFLLSG